MASSYTTNLNLEKPGIGEQDGDWGATLNTNFDTIDTKLAIKDEDDMSSDSASHLSTQQSIKAYVDSQVATEDTLAELNDTSISSPAAGHLVIYDNTASHWENATLTAGSNVSITNGDGSISIAATDTDTQLTQEQVEDYVGGMVTGNTETGIAVTYEDGDGTLDFVVSDTTVAGDSGSTGMTPGDTLTIAGGTNVTTAMSGDTLTVTSTDTNTQLSQENVEDYVGGMVTGNTETGISVTYEDGDGTLDFVVSDTTVAGDSGSTGMTPGDTLTIAGGTNITTAMSGDTLTVANDIVYETGTATLTLTGSTGAPTSAVTATAGYVKVGKMITVDIVFNGVSMSGSSGGVRITGLPYAAASVAVAPSLQHSAEVNGAYNVWYINSTQADLYTISDAAGWALAPVTASTVYHYGSFTYRTS